MEKRDDSPISNLKSRPFSVTWLAFGVLIIGIVNLIRFFQAIQQWSFLAMLLPFSPLYLVISGFIWTLVSLAVVWELWTGRRWARHIMLLFALAYTLYYWLDRLLLSGSGLSGNWFFTACANMILLAITAWILSLSSVKCYFRSENA